MPSPDHTPWARVIGATVKPYTRGKRHADEIMAREKAGPSPRRRRGYAVRSDRCLRRHEHKQARRAARAAERGDAWNDDA